jgi:hypothetical protein
MRVADLRLRRSHEQPNLRIASSRNDIDQTFVRNREQSCRVSTFNVGNTLAASYDLNRSVSQRASWRCLTLVNCAIQKRIEPRAYFALQKQGVR